MSLKLHEIRKRLDDLRTTAKGEIINLHERLEGSEITLDEWERDMQSLVSNFSLASYMLGYDNEGLPDGAIDEIDKHITSQQSCLSQFTEAIALGLAGASMATMTGSKRSDHLKWGAWRGRALSYVGALTAPFWMGVTRSYAPSGTPPPSVFPWEDPDIKQSLPLPAIPGDGSSLCGQWCRCEWDIKPIDESAGDYDCYWVMDREAEHCQTCIERAIRWSPLKIRNWDIVTQNIVPTTKEGKSVIKAIVIRKLKEKITEKGGQGSGNWGHGGLTGVHGGSSPKTNNSGHNNLAEKLEKAFDEHSGWYKGQSGNFDEIRDITDMYARGFITPQGKMYGSSANTVVKNADHSHIAMRILKEVGIDRGVLGSVDVLIGAGFARFDTNKIQLALPASKKVLEVVTRALDKYKDSYFVMDISNKKPHTDFEQKYIFGQYEKALWYLDRNSIEKPAPEILSFKGGRGSGNWGHSGLPGVHGGSSPTKNAGDDPVYVNAVERLEKMGRGEVDSMTEEIGISITGDVNTPRKLRGF